MGNKTSKYTLLKSRSIGSTIRAGLKLYTDNFRKIFKLSWPEAVAYAVICSALGTLSAIYMPEMLSKIISGAANIKNVMIERYMMITIIITLFIIGGVFELIFYSCGISTLWEHRDKDNITGPKSWFTFDIKAAWRTLKAAFFVLIPASLLFTIAILLDYGIQSLFIYTALVSPDSVAIKLISIPLLITAAILLLPFFHIAMKYIMRNEYHFIPLMLNEYLTSLRNTPYILAVVFISLTGVITTGFITSLPGIIISQANTHAYFGLAYGDPLGMPEYITWLTIATFFINGFFAAYIRMPLTFIIYYIYGSVESRESERSKMKATIGTTR